MAGMLTIRPTKMLARRLGIELPATPPAVANRVADWCAHEFRTQRFKYLIFFNTASLYPVLTYARGVTDDHELIERLVEAVKLNLEGTKLEFQYQRWIAPELAAVQWALVVTSQEAWLCSVVQHAPRTGAGHEVAVQAELFPW